MIEWTGETKVVAGHNFIWTDFVVCDMTEVAFIRIELKGTNDSYLAFAEEKEHKSKKITYVLGGWNNHKCCPSWISNGEQH